MISKQMQFYAKKKPRDSERNATDRTDLKKGGNLHIDEKVKNGGRGGGMMYPKLPVLCEPTRSRSFEGLTRARTSSLEEGGTREATIGFRNLSAHSAISFL